jgi:hypothetical protein
MPIKNVADIRLTAVSDAAWAMSARARERKTIMTSLKLML